ncbi:hypothetical protein DPV78_008294 [Talaromyces pinophilus]|nr:hypothetical protein DPV78_008294 [Talaromyces pinophilus]
MVDPLSLIGVVYPIARDLVELVEKLKKVYEGVRYAKQDLIKVMIRTNIVAGTYDFFRKTMKNVKRIKELASIFDRYGKLIETVKSESRKILERLKRITKIFWFQITEKPANTVDKWIAQFEWYKQCKKAVPSLFQDMKVLEKSMKTIATLVNTQILLQAYERDGSELILSQIKSSRVMLEVEVRKLEQARCRQEKFFLQHSVSPTQSPELKAFAQDILQIVEKGISRLQNSQPAPESPTTIDSRSPPVSPEAEVNSPVTPPSTPPDQSGRDRSFEVGPDVDPDAEPEVEPDVGPEAEEISMPRQKVRRRRTRSEPPPRFKTMKTKNSMTKITAKEKAYTCKRHLLDHRDLVHAHKLDELLLTLPASPVVRFGKETTGRVKANHI